MEKNFTQQGYKLPAEWEHQEAVILTWPKNLETWPHQLPQVEKFYCSFIREIAESQQVWLSVDPSTGSGQASNQAQENVQKCLKQNSVPLDRVRFFVIPTFDSWVRDYGPITLIREGQPQGAAPTTEYGRRLMTNWIFDGWGGKYDEQYRLDSKLPQILSKELNIPCEKVDFILEGGSIEVNGTGTLITSTNCLLNQNRNKKYTREQIEQVLCDHLGVKNIIWVSGEIRGDDTDGHIDDSVRFVNRDTVVCIFEDNKNDINYAGITNIYNGLLKAKLEDGRDLNVVKLPMPKPVYFKETRLPASYANFLITNEKVLVPVYRCPNDEIVLKTLQELFPKRKVVGLDCTDVVYGLGAIHCLSMQVPA